jgi:hypothetical protein
MRLFLNWTIQLNIVEAAYKAILIFIAAACGFVSSSIARPRQKHLAVTDLW